MKTNNGVTLKMLITHYGFHWLKCWYGKNIAHTSTHGKYICTTPNLIITGVSNHGDVHVEELRRYLYGK